MSFRDVVARMALDPEFARYARENPSQVGVADGERRHSGELFQFLLQLAAGG